MCDSADSVAFIGFLNQRLRTSESIGRQLLVGAVDEQVIGLGATPVVVGFLAHQQEYTAVVPFYSFDAQVVVRYNDEIQPGCCRRFSDFCMAP
ncbi:MAG: hypothetical protein BWY63_03819 [Chloroflexi bacterium ADurb.Bin360]|nr:MAG: hypothetical protein BWY63_03819 [Chloroflexi bacterium ADurb.Bin360]